MSSNSGLENEIRGLEADQTASMEYLSIQKEKLAKRLKNSEGEDMVKYLKNPPKPNRWKGFRMRVSRWWNNKRR